MIKKEFLELLERLKTERLLSSEVEDLFRAAKGNRYSLKLNFIQFSAVLGRQLNSDYNSGYKFECITDEELDVLVLFQNEYKELVGSLSGQNFREINVQVLGYDNLYQKPILGYLEGEISQRQLEVEDDRQVEAKSNCEAEREVEDDGQGDASNNVKILLKSGSNDREEGPKKLGAELKEGRVAKKFKANFQYIALDSEGLQKTGIRQGNSAAEVIKALRGEGLYPTQVVPKILGSIAGNPPKKKSFSCFLNLIIPPIIGLIMFIVSLNEGGNLVILGFFSFVLSIVLGVVFANVEDS
jgi:hypothetical protein